MKKILLMVLTGFMLAGLFACPHNDQSYDCLACVAEKEAKSAKKIVQDAASFGEAAGVISGYASESNSIKEFADNVASHEFESSTLQWAQDTGKAIGDAVADVYLWITED